MAAHSVAWFEAISVSLLGGAADIGDRELVQGVAVVGGCVLSIQAIH
jgi:hypothetical protein